MFTPKFGASISALLVEIPGDGNSTQGSMPSHMHSRQDLNYRRGYMWWALRKRGGAIRASRWTAPPGAGQAGSGPGRAVPPAAGTTFSSQDTVDYYMTWLRGLRSVYRLQMDALGMS